MSADERFIAKGEEIICPVSQLPLAGEHNEQNVLAACALTQGWVELDRLTQALSSFQGLAHRFEQVAEVGGVSFINDSKATNLGATMAALVGMSPDKQVVLIAGGDAKGVDLAPLSALLESRVHHLVALGQDGAQLIQLAESVGVAGTLVASMKEAVDVSHRVARQGNTVLLSPACASLDMFVSYADRGEQFVRAVRKLETGEAI
jgi:UDP-N-acetylmuramoylalanine--D-glutamate ligase